jgi:hypothetical protein
VDREGGMGATHTHFFCVNKWPSLELTATRLKQ